MSELIVELRQVTKQYEDRAVLRNLEFSVAAGDRISIVGSSGCGKSTLLNLLGTLDRPSSGEILFQGKDLAECSEPDLAALRREKIGFIFQLHHLLPQCTVLENVLVPTLAGEKPDKSAQFEASKRGEKLLERVGLRDHVTKYPSQLSGGERQRVAVVRSLINQPKLLLADEPTGALDEENAERLVDLLVEISNAEGVALVMVTHDRNLANRMRVTRELHGGRLK